MRKSQRQKQKQKHKKNNTTSRKFKGGNNDINGYVLAGFYNEKSFDFLDNVCLRSPIFLLKEKTLKHTLPPGLDNDPRTKRFFKRLSIPILYDLNFRGLILNRPSHLAPSNAYLYDGEELIYPTPLGHRFIWNSMVPLNPRNDMNEEEQTKIKEIELKYPGLFTRMFITEEEEEEALEKEMQKQRIKKETEAEIDQLFL